MTDDHLSLINDDDMERMANRLSLLGKATIDRFVAQLASDSDNQSKARALHVLGYMQEATAFPLVVNQLKSKDLTVAQAAVDALKSYNTDESRQALEELLKSGTSSLSRRALKALNGLNVELSLELLEKMSESQSWPLREELVYYLKSHKDESHKLLTEKLRGDEHLIVRKTANKYL